MYWSTEAVLFKEQWITAFCTFIFVVFFHFITCFIKLMVFFIYYHIYYLLRFVDFFFKHCNIYCHSPFCFVIAHLYLLCSYFYPHVFSITSNNISLVVILRYHSYLNTFIQLYVYYQWCIFRFFILICHHYQSIFTRMSAGPCFNWFTFYWWYKLVSWY